MGDPPLIQLVRQLGAMGTSPCSGAGGGGRGLPLPPGLGGQHRGVAAPVGCGAEPAWPHRGAAVSGGSSGHLRCGHQPRGSAGLSPAVPPPGTPRAAPTRRRSCLAPPTLRLLSHQRCPALPALPAVPVSPGEAARGGSRRSPRSSTSCDKREQMLLRTRCHRHRSGTGLGEAVGPEGTKQGLQSAAASPPPVPALAPSPPGCAGRGSPDLVPGAAAAGDTWEPSTVPGPALPQQRGGRLRRRNFPVRGVLVRWAPPCPGLCREIPVGAMPWGHADPPALPEVHHSPRHSGGCHALWVASVVPTLG